MGNRQDNHKQKLIEYLAQMPIIQVACQRAGVSRATYYRWHKEDADFAALADEALEGGVATVNDLAESKLIASINSGNINAVRFWLNNRHYAYGHMKLVKDSQQDHSKEEKYKLLTEEFEKKVSNFLDDTNDI